MRLPRASLLLRHQRSRGRHRFTDRGVPVDGLDERQGLETVAPPRCRPGTVNETIHPMPLDIEDAFLHVVPEVLGPGEQGR
jgi:hypothetical protein